MQRIGYLALLLAIAAALANVGWSAAARPERVATHFAFDRGADAWSTRDQCVLLFLAISVAMPLLTAGLVALAARRAPLLVNIPNGTNWLAPERRARTVDHLATQALWFAATLALFLAGVYLLVVRANTVAPPHLPGAAFTILLVVFLGVAVAGTALLYARFRLLRG